MGETTTCRECRSELVEGAIRCAACGVRQDEWWSRPVVVGVGLLILAVVFVAIALTA